MTHILLNGNELFKDEVNLLILNATIDFFCLQTDVINHFILPEFTGVFLSIRNYMATTLQFLKF